jgi:hypothetical protein
VTFYRFPRRFIRADEAEIGLPSSVCHLLQPEREAGAYLLGVHFQAAAQDWNNLQFLDRNRPAKLEPSPRPELFAKSWQLPRVLQGDSS